MKSLLRKRRGFRIWSIASSWNVTRRIGRNCNISVEGRHIGTRRNGPAPHIDALRKAINLLDRPDGEIWRSGE
jgi:hypothetical protein